MTYAYSFPSFIAYQSSAGLHWVPGAFHALFPVSVSHKAGVFYRLGSHNTPINVMPRRGGGRAWGGDLIVFVGPGVGHLTDLVLPGEGIFESFFARRGEF